MSRTVLILVLGAGLLATGGAVATAAPDTTFAAVQDVTLTMTRFYSNVCNCHRARASGRIASGAADEEVVILKQWCGRSFGTADAAAQTREGGFFETEVAFVPGPEFWVSASYRARWNGRLSEPVLFRGRLTVSGKKLTGRRHQVTVRTSNVNPVNLKSRTVVLQRQTGTTWTRIASAKLVPHRVRYYTFVATLTAPRRGWTLRALVPAKSAAPCFIASTSEKWTS